MGTTLTYRHLTHHIIPGPQSFSYFVPLILLPIALLIPRTILSRWQSNTLFIPAIVAATVHAWQAMGCVDVISVNEVLWCCYLLVLKDPWEDFSLVKSPIKSQHPAKDARTIYDAKNALDSGVTNPKNAVSNNSHDSNVENYINEERYPQSLTQRLPWVGKLVLSIRLNNWKINQPSHDRHQPPAPAFPNRTQFVLQALLSFSCAYIILDFTSACTSYDSYFSDLNIPITAPLPFHQQLAFIPPQLFRSAIVGLQAWTLISQMFYLPCLLPVGLNALRLLPDEWSPHTWGTYFGSPRAIFQDGVRGFWGQYWHQTMRCSCSAPGYAIADKLGIKPGTLARYTIITVVTFGFSGTVHSGMVPPDPLHATVDENTIRLYIAGFFWLQPLAMLVEVLTIRLLKATGVAELAGNQSTVISVRSVVNAIWVTFWFALCMPLLAEARRQLGYSGSELVPFSIWKAARGGELGDMVIL